jgi:hypothetical protein
MTSTHRIDPRRWRPRQVVAVAAAATMVASMIALGSAWATTSKNKIDNSGFEKTRVGWASHGPGARLTRIPGGHSGAYAGRLTASQPGADLVLNDVPSAVRNPVQGRTYLASVWVRTSSQAAVALRLREWHGGKIVARSVVQAPVQHSWKQLSVSLKAKSSGGAVTLGVIKRNAPKGFTLDVDGIKVRVRSASKAGSGGSGAARSGHGTLFGEAMWMKGGESWPQTFQRLQSTYGRIDMVRAYLTKPQSGWSGYLSVGPRPMNVSFKAAPKDILSGKYDATLKSWFRTAPKNRPIWWTYYHEPEDNIAKGEFTAAQYRDAWRHIANIAKANAPKNLKATLVLMDWSAFPNSGRNWRDYYPGSKYIDVLAWDGYNSHGLHPTRYYKPAEDYSRAVKVSKAAGKPFGFAEWGSELVKGDDGTGRARWMKQVARYFQKNGAVFAAYFDTPVVADYQLTDRPSQKALHDIMSGNF